MQIANVPIYGYKDLSQTAREKVLNDLQDINVVDDSWFEGVYEKVKRDLEHQGCSGIKINFSGFFSQGDGASFTARTFDISKYIKSLEKLEMNLPVEFASIESDDIDAEITRTSHQYVHENTVKFKILDNTPLDDDLVNRVDEWMNERLPYICKDIYSQLQREYEHLTSQDSVESTIEANEYVFFENGGLATHLEQYIVDISTDKKRAENAANNLLNFINGMCYDTETFIEYILKGHPTLQQGFYRLIYKAIDAMARVSEEQLDTRRRAAWGTAVQIKYLMDRAHGDELILPIDKDWKSHIDWNPSTWINLPLI